MAEEFGGEVYDGPAPSYEELEAQSEEMEDDMAMESMEKQQDWGEDMTPAYEKKDDLFSLFWKMVNKADSSKIANLSKQELGMLNLPVRDCQKIALLANTLGHKGFAKFFSAQAEIISSTSLSKGGFLPQIVVTSRRVKAKDENRELPEVLRQPPKKKRKIF